MVSVRRSTFQVFDGMREKFEQSIESIKRSSKQEIKVITDPTKPVWFRINCYPLTLNVEVQKEGIIFLSFGIPDRRKPALYNWILKGMQRADSDDVNWYLFNMKDSVGPDFLVTNWLEVIKFFMKELMFNQDMYLNPPIIFESSWRSQ